MKFQHKEQATESKIRKKLLIKSFLFLFWSSALCVLIIPPKLLKTHRWKLKVFQLSETWLHFHTNWKNSVGGKESKGYSGFWRKIIFLAFKQIPTKRYYEEFFMSEKYFVIFLLLYIISHIIDWHIICVNIIRSFELKRLSVNSFCPRNNLYCT